jgi:hypothetical protein
MRQGTAEECARIGKDVFRPFVTVVHEQRELGFEANGNSASRPTAARRSRVRSSPDLPAVIGMTGMSFLGRRVDRKRRDMTDVEVQMIVISAGQVAIRTRAHRGKH